MFTKIVGDLPLSAYSKEEVLDFNNMIQRLPSNFGKSSKDMRTAREVIEQTEREEEFAIPALIDELKNKGMPDTEIDDALADASIKRISAATMKRHQNALNAIFKHAWEINAISSNPFKGRTLTTADIKRRQRSEKRIERIGWGDHIYRLFGSEKFTNPLVEIGDPMFWTPLIATFSGLRMEEILQLRLRDFATEDAIHYLAVQNELGTQSVKSENGMRKVPLHKALIDLGLLKLIALREAQNGSRLFPSVARSKSKGTLSGTMSKNFAYTLKAVASKSPDWTFTLCVRTS